MLPSRKTRQVPFGNAGIRSGAWTALAVAAVITIIALSPASSARADQPPTYRSSPLGFSMKTPDGWRQFIQPICGTGLVGKTDEQLSRMPMLAVSFRNDELQSKLHVHVWRKFDGNRSQRLKWLTQSSTHELTPFQFADSLKGQRLRVRRDTLDATVYIVEPDHRRIELEFSYPFEHAPDLEAHLDEVARGLKILLPVTEAPSDSFKSLRGRGFVVQYPGQWTWKRPWDDEEARAPKYVHIEGPLVKFGSADTRVEVSVYSEKKGPGSLGELRDVMTAGLKKSKGVEFDWSTFKTHQGREGLRLEYRMPGAMIPTTSLIYYFVKPDQEMVEIHCLCFNDRISEFEATFDEIAKRLILE